MFRLSRVAGLCVSGLVLALGLVVAPSAVQVASADTAPAPGVPATVTADALPTWQVNGVVWSQVVVGNTVYATGSFATARPPGVAVGGAGEIPVANLFAYDIRTGERVPGFSHSLNAQGLVIHATADGSRLYVGGDFTAVDGQPRGHIAAFDTATGALVPGFAPSLDGTVKAITTSGTWVYAGGAFFHAGTVYRQRLASFAAVNGGLSSTWTPRASTADVRALLMAPDRSKVLIGGSFLTLSSVTANGMGAVDPINGAVLPWAANQVIKDYAGGGITSLTTDGTSVFGSGFAFGTGGTFEGSFSLNPADGSINWIADCLGDTYSTYADTDVVYSVGHAHNCSNIGGFPDTSPRVRWQRALATTKAATQKILKPDAYGWDFTGSLAPSLLQWYPGLEDGTASGQAQASWSVVGTGDYIALGGEFPIVNNSAQQGLTRFAKSSKAPNAARPRFDVVPAKVVPTTAAAIRPGSVRLSYGSAWDRDNESLTYDVFRDGTTLVNTSVVKTNFWTTPVLSLTDTNVPAGTHTYTVRVTDPSGNTNWTTESNAVTAGSTSSGYASSVFADAPGSFWRLNEPSGPFAFDYTGSGNDANVATGVTRGVPGATNDADTAVALSGTATGLITGSTPAPAPDTFTVEAWFTTTTTTGGKIIGYGNGTDGSSSTYDRHVYMDNTGRVLFGVYPGAVKVVSSERAYNDGQWHHVSATLGSQGQVLYVDGQLVGRDVSVTSGQPGFVGQWVVGGDTVAGWTSAPTSKFFKGSVDDVAIYPTALGLAQVRAHVAASGRAVALPPSPTDAYGTSVIASGPSFYWRLGEASGVAATDSTGLGERATYAGTPLLGQPGAVGGTDTSATFNGTSSTMGSVFNSSGPAAFSAELWFRTTTAVGGQLIGFGDKQTGLSTTTERSLSVLNSGQLRLAVNNNATVVDSPAAYRDGQWHQAVVSQGTDGTKLYVDGSLVGSAAQTGSQTFAGFWRVGGDKVSSGSSSSYLAGGIDDVSVFARALTGADVRAHYKAAGRTLPNALPVAAFATSTTQRSVAVDGSTSSDDDGPLASWSWSFGDGQSGTGVTTQHLYAAPGTYTITLTVTDAQGATATRSAQVTIVNLPPTASFGARVAKHDLAVDASASADPDGRVTGYSWDFGDGTVGSGPVAQHTYAAAGTFAVVLTVTDQDGGSASQRQDVTAVDNIAPTAAFTTSVTGKAIAVDGSGSADPDGTVAGYAWDFGDGTTGTRVTESHTYASSGDHVVTLVVTDNDGATARASRTVAVVNQAPSAAFTAMAADLSLSVDGTSSFDPDGTLTSYAWDFGDGTSATGPTASHTYAVGATYTVVLTVTDNDGASSSSSRAVGVQSPNLLPSATFTATSPGDLLAALDASASTDPDGTIRSYVWGFGDGQSGTGATTSHAYAAPGTYQVTLTVTDDRAGVATVTRPVTVAGPFASDTFTRTQTGGWGAATSGGSWSTQGGASLFAVTNGVGTLKSATAGSGSAVQLTGPASTDTDLRFTFSVDKLASGGGSFLSATGRGTFSDAYRTKVQITSTGAVVATLTKVVGNVETSLISKAVTGLAVSPASSYSVRMQTWGSGTTALRAKVWATSDLEPTGWLVAASDTTAGLQTAASIGLRTYVSGTATNAPQTFSIDNVAARATGN